MLGVLLGSYVLVETFIPRGRRALVRTFTDEVKSTLLAVSDELPPDHRYQQREETN